VYSRLRDGCPRETVTVVSRKRSLLTAALVVDALILVAVLSLSLFAWNPTTRTTSAGGADSEQIDTYSVVVHVPWGLALTATAMCVSVGYLIIRGIRPRPVV
jgi:hypothetical protein